MVPSLTSGSRHQDGPPGAGGAWVSGGAGLCAVRCPVRVAAGYTNSAPGAAFSSGAPPDPLRRRCDQWAAAPSARTARTEKTASPPLSSIDRNRAQPTSAANTAASVEPSTRPVSSFFASLSSSPSWGSSSQAKP